MSTYTTGELADLCHVTVRTIQYYDHKGILKPAGITEGSRRYYTEEQVQQMKLILFLKDVGCSLNDIKNLLAEESTLTTLNAMLEIKEQQLAQQIQQRQQTLHTIKQLQHYVNHQSTSPITHLIDIEQIMTLNNDMRRIRRNIWLSAGIVGMVQYSGIISSIVMKNKWPLIGMLTLAIPYSLAVTYYYYRHVNYMCPNCQHIFKPTLWQVIKAPHTAKTRQFKCPNCHETHYCIEVSSKVTKNETSMNEPTK